MERLNKTIINQARALIKQGKFEQAANTIGKTEDVLKGDTNNAKICNTIRYGDKTIAEKVILLQKLKPLQT